MVSHLSAALWYLELFTEGQTLVNSGFLHPFWYVDRCGLCRSCAAWVQCACPLQKTVFYSSNLGLWALRIPPFP